MADLIYNPAQTVLLQKAAAFGKACAGGLWMLCAQALKAQEIWTGRAYDEALCASLYSMLQTQPTRTNTVLIGMPGSGKTTIGQLLAQRLGQSFADTDSMIEAAHGRIQYIFETQGEPAFRTLELSAARQAAALTHTVISTGGGIVLTQAAIHALAETGIIVYIDRPLEAEVLVGRRVKYVVLTPLDAEGYLSELKATELLPLWNADKEVLIK